MKWQIKAFIGKIVAMLPLRLSYEMHYFGQRRFGNLRNISPVRHFRAARRMIDQIYQEKFTIEGKTILEIGTGRRINVPLAFWLCGASQIYTVDLNPYLKYELLSEDIDYIRQHQEEMLSIFGIYFVSPIFRKRFKQLIKFDGNLNDILDLIRVQYIAPADAANLDFSPRSVDFHVSFSVFQYIRPESLEAILLEGRRILKEGGLLVHLITLSDNFSYVDRSISGINFLQFSENEWQFYAGNRFMYHNRMRVYEFVELFERLGLTILSIETQVDNRSMEQLRNGFPLEKRFQGNSEIANVTSGLDIVAASK
jgi:SAM-dependent methyltransferase